MSRRHRQELPTARHKVPAAGRLSEGTDEFEPFPESVLVTALLKGHRLMIDNRVRRATTPIAWVLAITAIASLVVSLDQLVVATALPTIRADLHASMADLEWTVNAFSLSLATLLIPASQLGDRIGRRRTLVIGLALFGLASIGCAVSGDIATLLIARVVQGIGGALILPTALALLAGSATPKQRGVVMGVFAAVMGLGVVIGPLVGGAVAQGLTWHWIFWINVPIIATIIPLVATKVVEAKGESVGTDVLGIAFIGLSIFFAVWGLVRSGDAEWFSAEVVGTLSAAVVLFVAFVVWELRAKEPMIPLRLFAIPAFAAGNISALLLTASLFSTVFFFAQYLQIGLGYSPLEAGLRFLPWALPVCVLSPIAGRLQQGVSPRWFIFFGLVIQTCALGWLAFSASARGPYMAEIPPLLLSGIGIAMAMPAQQNAVMSSVLVQSMGKAAGTFSTVRQLGGVLGVAIAAAVFSAYGSDQTPGSFSSGFTAAIITMAALSLVGAGVGIFARGRARETKDDLTMMQLIAEP